ncbi:MAG TPA: hypothetical protein PKH33_04285 [bacterium]|nr:hypothetical protein [bacterium]
MEFQSFDTWDEMMAAIEKARVAADGRVKEWQSAIKTGACYIQATEYGFFIFGEILDADDAFYKSQEGRNYRLCRAYSVACPDGESGDVHVSVITAVISRELFEAAKSKGWNIEPQE